MIQNNSKPQKDHLLRIAQPAKKIGNDGEPGEIRLDRPFGLLGGIALVIGGIIGMGIYALIAVGLAGYITPFLPFDMPVRWVALLLP